MGQKMGKAPHFCGASQPENPVAGEPLLDSVGRALGGAHRDM